MEGTIGEIRIFAGSFAPRGWMFCAGQLLAVQQYSAVFAILGVTYGGNGQTTFGLPNLQGRVPIGAGTGVGGLSTVPLGQIGGAEKVTLTVNELPTHSHGATSFLKANSSVTTSVPQIVGNSLGVAKDINGDAASIYSTGTPDVNLNSGSIATTVQPIGNNLPLPIRNPYLGVNYIICLEGIFPSRN